MSQENKKYQKPVLNGLGDRNGKLSDGDLQQISGGVNCNEGGTTVCWNGIGTFGPCFWGDFAGSGYDRHSRPVK